MPGWNTVMTNLSVLQMYETASLKGEAGVRKVCSLNKLWDAQSARLKAKEAMSTVRYSMKRFGSTILKPQHMYIGTEPLSKMDGGW